MIAATRVAALASLFYFLVGNVLGLLMGSGLISYLWRPAHAHINLLGFVAMMIYGVAYHALPRFAGKPFRRPRFALGQVILANIGLLGMALSWGLALPTAVFAIWGSIQLVASVTFVALIAEVLLRPALGVGGGRRI